MELGQELINAAINGADGGPAPHAWLRDGSSLFDTFGPGYTLLATGGWTTADLVQARIDARQLGLRLNAIQPDAPHIATLYQARLALICPRRQLAWRGDIWPLDGQELLRQISGRSHSTRSAKRPGIL